MSDEATVDPDRSVVCWLGVALILAYCIYQDLLWLYVLLVTLRFRSLSLYSLVPRQAHRVFSLYLMTVLRNREERYAVSTP